MTQNAPEAALHRQLLVEDRGEVESDVGLAHANLERQIVVSATLGGEEGEQREERTWTCVPPWRRRWIEVCMQTSALEHPQNVSHVVRVDPQGAAENAPGAVNDEVYAVRLALAEAEALPDCLCVPARVLALGLAFLRLGREEVVVDEVALLRKLQARLENVCAQTGSDSSFYRMHE